MSTDIRPGGWQRPYLEQVEGRHVRIARLDPNADVEDLYEASHGDEVRERLWRYLWHGPFADRHEMLAYLKTCRDNPEALFYSIYSIAHGRKIGMYSLLNIVPEMGRAEVGHIWYGPMVQKTRVNTETTFLFLRHLFDDLGYRRAEWKCDNANAESKRTAQRMGFQFEGLFRQHMVVKGRNRDTAWFSIIDSEWPVVRENFERYLASDSLSLTELNRGTP
jgi:RimJ/RimL family protein N-acetyltransferase